MEVGKLFIVAILRISLKKESPICTNQNVDVEEMKNAKKIGVMSISRNIEVNEVSNLFFTKRNVKITIRFKSVIWEGVKSFMHHWETRIEPKISRSLSNVSLKTSFFH